MQVEPVTMQMEMKVRGRLTLKEHDHECLLSHQSVVNSTTVHTTSRCQTCLMLPYYLHFFNARMKIQRTLMTLKACLRVLYGTLFL